MLQNIGRFYANTECVLLCEHFYIKTIVENALSQKPAQSKLISVHKSSDNDDVDDIYVQSLEDYICGVLARFGDADITVLHYT